MLKSNDELKMSCFCLSKSTKNVSRTVYLIKTWAYAQKRRLMVLCSKGATNGHIFKSDDDVDMSGFCFSNHHPRRLWTKAHWIRSMFARLLLSEYLKYLARCSFFLNTTTMPSMLGFKKTEVHSMSDFCISMLKIGISLVMSSFCLSNSNNRSP